MGCHICDNDVAMTSRTRFRSGVVAGSIGMGIAHAPVRAVVRWEQLQRWFGLSQGKFADAIGVSRQTVNRWKMTGTSPTSDSAEAGWLALLAEIRSIAAKTWDSPQEFRRWLRTPLPILNMQRPIDFFKPGSLAVVVDLVRAEAGGGYS